MTERTITVSGKEVTFRSSAAIPRLYRVRFGRDIFRDLSALEKSFNTKSKKGGNFEITDLEVFENIAYIMAKHADKTIPDNIDEWLEDFEMFSIYEVLPAILEMWNINMKTDVVPKKK
jgi:hypothetical protein